jgi:hypothetical protein
VFEDPPPRWMIYLVVISNIGVLLALLLDHIDLDKVRKAIRGAK